MTPGFSSFHVQPAYGPSQVLLRWTLSRDIYEGRLHIYRSDIGLPGSWKRMTADAGVPAALGCWLDQEVAAKPSAVAPLFYRALLIAPGPDGKMLEIDGPVVSTASHLSGVNYGAISRLLNMELAALRRTSSNRVLLLVPKQGGKLAGNINPLTGQPLPPCQGGGQNSEPGSFGTALSPHGFYAPVTTYMSMTGPIQRTMSTGDQASTNVTTSVTAYSMTYPAVIEGSVFVDPFADIRYIVQPGTIVAATFNGLAHLRYEFTLFIAPRNDPVYQININNPVELFWKS
jgi:hypothetical protein